MPCSPRVITRIDVTIVSHLRLQGCLGRRKPLRALAAETLAYEMQKFDNRSLPTEKKANRYFHYLAIEASITRTSTPRTDHATVRIQLVFTSFSCCSAVNSTESASCAGTCKNAVENQITATSPSPNHVCHAGSDAGRATHSQIAAPSSANINGATTQVVSFLWSCSYSKKASVPTWPNNG